MGESGKRQRNAKNGDGGGRDQKRRSSSSFNKESAGDGELVVYRILCPNALIGGVIGKGGKVINSIRNETKAKVQLVDPFPGSDLRVFTIYCYVKDKDAGEIEEDGDEPLCAAQDALLRVHAAILESKANRSENDEIEKVEAQMLVPGSQAAGVIGKGGATIKRLRTTSRASIKVDPKDPNDPTQSCAMSFDNFVVISGEEESVKKALYAISTIMYKFPAREEISLATSVPELPPSNIIPHDFPIYPSGGFYPNIDSIVPPAPYPPIVGTASSIPEFRGYADTVSSWPSYQPVVPVVPAVGGQSRAEELVVKVVCPSDVLGRVIGKGGSSIKNMRQASGAKIDADNVNRGGECVITVTSTESINDLKSAAVEAVLLLQEKINDEDEERVNIRLLVPKIVVGSLIGKGGATINEMRKITRADIQVLKGEQPKCASPAENIVEVIGEVPHVRDALLHIILKLRDNVLRERNTSVDAPPPEPTYTSSFPVHPAIPSAQPVAPVGYDTYDQKVDTGSRMGTLTSGNLYGYASLRGVDSAYGGSLSSYGSRPYGGLPPFEMVIPANAISKVLGKGGANLDNIRKISGAAIEILDSKSSRLERIAQISGTNEQTRSAENLIHAFIMAT